MPVGSQEKSTTVQCVTMGNLQLDVKKETERICETIRQMMVKVKRRGAVIGLSGGIDSSVTAALCARAAGKEKVLGILMPEIHSASESSSLGKKVADALGIEVTVHNITPILEAAGCYSSQTQAIQSVIPEYRQGFPFKIVLPQISNIYRVFSLVVQMPDGTSRKERMSHQAYLQLVAATNFKQRIRKMLEYYHADRLNYLVAGSPNRLEYDQGFFVKNGDGSADIKPIAHLYKSQVYQMAEYLGIPEEIRKRPPTTDTYPMEQSQEEFYFSLPYQKMDLCLYAKNNGYSPESVCEATGLTHEQCSAVFADIDNKRKTTQYLHLKPHLVESISEISYEI